MDSEIHSSAQDALATLAQALGEDAVDRSTEARRLAGQDVFTDDPDRDPLAVLVPRNAEDAARALQILSARRIAVAPRGGGMSYTEGFLPHRPYVTIDLRRLNRIRSVLPEDEIVIAEAGCTWAQIVDHLAPLGLIPALKPPISGSVSTIGGGASQNLPSGMEHFIGLEIALIDGSMIRTGALSMHDGPLPLRNFGPDTTGLFLGDCGAFGVKTAVALRLRRKPASQTFLSFSFATMPSLAEAMTSLQQSGNPLSMMALDSVERQGSAALGWREKLATAQHMAAARRYSPASLWSLARGWNAERTLAASAFSLHLTIEADGTTHARDLRHRIAAHALGFGGVPIPATLPEALAAKPFSVRGMLGKSGERWAPVHGIFRPSLTQQAVALVQAFFEEQRAQIEQFKIGHSFLFSCGRGFFLIEPMFYWRDEIPVLHRSVLAHRTLAKFEDASPNVEARRVVRALRLALAKRFDEIGAAKCQVGRTYAYGVRLSPETLHMMQALKRTLDPHNLMNPGVLGLDETS